MTSRSTRTDSGVSRRSLIAGTAAGLGLAATGLGTGAAGASARSRGDDERRDPQPVGPLVDDPAGRLSLPRGFAYTVIAESGVTTLTSGHKTPGRIDGTGAFSVGGRVRLVQNHELGVGAADPVPAVPGTVYDAGIGDAGAARSWS